MVVGHMAAKTKEGKAKSLQTIYRTAAGSTLTLKAARALIENPPCCPYCKLNIPWTDLSLDHKLPKARGGTNNSDNLVWTDFNCNLIKGKLTATEFTELMTFLSDKPFLKQYLTTRLRAAGGVMFGTSRKWRRARYHAKRRGRS